ncbi:MAG: type III pantothenate kinase [Bacteroidetes bacterium]|nr:type III pantothenate kinase [Bacteroidota bacterium]
MNLILDFGNTNKKLAVMDPKESLDQLYPSRDIDVEVHRLISLSTVKKYVDRHPGIRSCILSSVVPYPESIREFLRNRFNIIELDEHTPLPVVNKYKSPDTLGKDRIAAAVAGCRLFPHMNVLVINAGTCITCDFVNAKREYLGGSISPGLEMRFRALHTFTKQLPLLSWREINFLAGTDTEKSILSGVINGMTAEMEGIAAAYREEHPEIRIIVSGGDMNYFVKRLKISIFAVPNIVIHGLQQILVFNDTKTL